MPYHPTQEAVFDYARGVLDSGFRPGVIMIDDESRCCGVAARSIARPDGR